MIKTPRDVSGALQMLRNFLLGRQHTNALRFSPFLASRSPPLPEIPDGPCHKLNNNYYYSRDGRREIRPPIVLASPTLLAAGNQKSATKSAPTPGEVFKWD